MESPKSQSHNKSDEDMISNLPDFIIGRILSFLPTKDAVRTSVLSRKWIHNWTLITDLLFKDSKRAYSSKEKAGFLNFVNRVLCDLNSSSIQSFSLVISEKYEPSQLDQWISAVVSRRVKNLCVDSEKDRQDLSSHSLLKFKSLEKLILNVKSCDIIVPPFACFSSLTFLRLSGIQFTRDTSDNSGNLHLDFPVLRTYETICCTWSSRIKCVTLKAPMLEVLSLENNVSYPVILKFCASRLREFNYMGNLCADSLVLDLSVAHIASANIDVNWFIHKGISDGRLQELPIQLLKLIKNVECLKFLRQSEVKLAKNSLVDLPVFEMLAHLELGEVTGEVLLGLLLRTPHLKTLVLYLLDQHYLQELFVYDRVPDCFLTSLQVVELLGFDGSQHQLIFAKFVMENAVSLKRLSFRHPCGLPGSKLEEVKEKLFSFKKCSSFMSLEFTTN